MFRQVIVLAVLLGWLTLPADDPGFSKEALEKHVEGVRKKLPHEGFSIIVEKPFVVVGDEPRSTVQRRAVRTVRWATELLMKSYFEKYPPQILDVWLFKDDGSYEKHAKLLFGSRPTTPFGYYSSHHGALVMNIGTGGGTLVHEMVHAFMDSNFPACPAWFNEGLGSLYEQCREKDGRIWGLPNWRLAGLKKALAGDGVPSFETLTATSSHEFYDEDPGTNYAQARYLLYYLQHRGLLRKYYTEFRAKHEKDPTGYRTLKRILGEEDMEAFQKRWEQFISKLRYPS